MKNSGIVWNTVISQASVSSRTGGSLKQGAGIEFASWQMFADVLMSSQVCSVLYVIGIDDLMYEAFTPLDVRHLAPEAVIRDQAALVTICVQIFMTVTHSHKLAAFPSPE